MTAKALLETRTGATLSLRVAFVAIILLVEKSLLNFFVDFDEAQAAQGFGALVRNAQHLGLRFVVTVALAATVLCYVRGNERLSAVNHAARSIHPAYGWIALHFVCIAALAPLVATLYANGDTPLPFELQAAACLVLALGGVFSLLATFAPARVWVEAVIALGRIWVYALFAGFIATFAIQWSQALWAPLAHLTFELVRWVLSAFIGSLQGDPTTGMLSTDRFAVQVTDVCSGLEGIGLMLAFSTAWLVFFRKDYVFPRALLLIPVGIVLIFGLNVLRIAALVTIGHVGFPEVAESGFHSQAGWIAFNCAACGIAFFSRRSRWLTRGTPPDTAAVSRADTENPTASYLMPLLAVLAAGMVARAVSDGFEILYGLRLVAGVAALVTCWPRIARLDWHFTWRGPLAGLIVFGIWMAGESLLVTQGDIPARLADATPLFRVTWILVRALTAVSIVPIAEELAFRGYLLRRLVNEDFEIVRFAQVGIWPLLASSLAFGLPHGTMWLPAVAAGLVYGIVIVRTGRIGEAVAAHATTNALLAIGVLIFDQWQYW